jgi:glycerophosphoryl diester phosphodiesterase
MEAFSRSYALGLRYLETDVRRTADGVLVAFHDANLDRVTDGRGAVSKRTHADLQRLRVDDIHPIPTLVDVLRAFPDACFTVDLKDHRAGAELVRVLMQTASASRVCVAGAWDGSLRRLRDRAGAELTTALGWRELATLIAAPRIGGDSSRERSRATFAHVPLQLGRLRVYRESLVARVHDLGLALVVWTVDEPDQMHRLLDDGVDGIIADRPDLLREVLIARDQWTASTTTPARPGA